MRDAYETEREDQAAGEGMHAGGWHEEIPEYEPAIAERQERVAAKNNPDLFADVLTGWKKPQDPFLMSVYLDNLYAKQRERFGEG